MLLQSQPLDSKISERFKSESDIEPESMSEQNIKSQRIGKMFDYASDDDGKRKVSLKTRLGWKWRNVRGLFHDFKYIVRNHAKWHKTMCELRPWEGFDGLFVVMLAHLKDYVVTEELYSHTTEEYKNMKIASVKETIELLERMKDPHGYSTRRRNVVESRYPEYKSLITEYKSGGTEYSGDFFAQGDGWVGIESGNNPREGYFEFVDGRFELEDSPSQLETDKLLDELKKYHEEISNAYEQAEIDSDKDFEKLGQLLKENLYSWWD